MFTLAFWKGAAERGIKTGAQAGLAFFVVGTTSLIDFDWPALGGVAGAAVVFSLLTSLANPDFVSGKPKA